MDSELETKGKHISRTVWSAVSNTAVRMVRLGAWSLGLVTWGFSMILGGVKAQFRVGSRTNGNWAGGGK